MELIVHSAGKKMRIPFREKQNLLSLLRENGINIPARCGGNGTCGKCRVKLLSGALEGEEKGGFYLACKSQICSSAEIEVYETEGGGLTETQERIFAADGESGFGAALDLGTTTMAFSLVDLKDGKELAKRSCLNPQGAFGADVLSRIKAASEGARDKLKDCVLKKTAEVLSDLCREAGVCSLKRLTVAGNTTMLHLFIGADAAGIGRYPFTPAFTDTQRVGGSVLALPCEEVVLLPSASAFIGSDVICGAHFVGLDKTEGMLLDLGTNGEILLNAGGRIFTTSAAAGPAFEGANIECGTGGVAGAIDRVKAENGKISFTTVGGAPAVGICGSGLTDAVAALLETGEIDETGAMRSGRFDLTDGVYLTQKDVREFQLAKSAIAAAVQALLARAGVAGTKLYVAGGMGFYLDKESVEKTGLLPPALASSFTAAGNTGLGGAKACLVSSAALQACEKLARSAEYFDLSCDEVFMEKYMEYMGFPGAEE